MSKSAIIITYICFTAVLLAQAERSVQGAFGAVTIDGKVWNQIALRPVIPIWKFGVALDLVFYIDADGNIHKDEWDFSDGEAIKNTLIDKIYYIRFGFPNDPLYFKVGSLDYVKLGYGILVNGYSNAIEYPQVRKVGLGFSVKRNLFSVQGFVNDFKENLGLTGIRVQTPVLAGIPIGVSAVMDRNQHLGLKDRDGDKYPDFFDHFPDDEDKYSNAMDNYEEWRQLYLEFEGSNPDSFDVWFNTLPLDHNTFNHAEIKDDPMSAIAIDIGYPVVTEQNMSIAIYAQIAKMIGEANYPGNPDSTVSLGSGIIPVGVAAKFGPAYFNLEYRIIPKGNFEFGYWNKTYEIERVSIESDLIKTKESKLGRFGKQKGIFANFSMDVFGLIGFHMAYQNLRGDIWDGNMFSNQANQSFQSELGLKKRISRIKTAKLFYQQLNVPNPFEFEFTESTVMGYRIAIELGSGMVLNYTYQRTFRMNSDGELEPVNLTGIETSFTF
ncbi:MAG TPA: hypothetical protein EYO24_05495 [Candidatus Marinimicrobia bacterium]|nr:hypothetical protein [Candidatus Neomarinimicrobiota bacterium]